jgi:membrane protein required for colicin V production
MILDVIVAISGILAFYRGWQKGIIAAILSFVGVVLGVVFSLKLSYTLAAYLTEQNIINNKYVLLISFILLFIGVILVFKLIIGAIEKVLKLAMLGWANRLAGAVLYVFGSLLFISFLFWLGSKVGIVNPQAKSESKTYSIIAPIAPKTIEVASDYMPYCKDLLTKVQSYFQALNKN